MPEPFGLSFDGDGRLLLAEGFVNGVRRVELDGTIDGLSGGAIALPGGAMTRQTILLPEYATGRGRWFGIGYLVRWCCLRVIGPHQNE